MTDTLPRVDLDEVPLCSICRVEDFTPLTPWIREVLPWGVERHGADFPTEVAYRKHWEVAQAARSMAEVGVLHRGAEVLGVGAGNEPTLFWLTNYVGRVFATDLYLAEGWEESANSRMLRDPGPWPSPWDPRRLVVQHMDALDLRYPDDSFDAVFSSSSIEHFGGFDEVVRAVLEAFRVLRPGGVFTVSTELRLRGPGPGIPGALLFSWDEFQTYIVNAAPWEVVGPVRRDGPLAGAFVTPFLPATEVVQAHTAEHGELMWHLLDWPEYPMLEHEHDGRVWTSAHVALRKPVPRSPGAAIQGSTSASGG